MEDPVPATAPDATPPWRLEPRGHLAEIEARRLTRRTWTLLAILVVVIGSLLGLVSSFRSRPYPAFLPIVVGRIFPSGPTVAFAEADLAALARPGLFARTIGDPTLLGPTETIARRLERLDAVSSRESLVVLLVAPARVGPDGQVQVLGTGSRGDEPDLWIPLREILARVLACPARNRLVLLDLMRPMADPITGILADDAPARIGHAVDAATPSGKDLFVLSACEAGQRSWASEELGRSVFGLTVEEGLSGRADAQGGNGDGQVTVRELARYVTRRTQTWVWHNRQAWQTPVLLESGTSRDRLADFPLTHRNRNEPAPSLAATESEVRTYPDWLKAAWSRRDGLVAGGNALRVPRALRLMNAALLAAEQDWRGGGDPIQIQGQVEKALATLDRQFTRLSSEQRLPLRSLALEVRQGRLTDPAVNAAMADLLKKRSQPAIGLKPEEAATADAKLLAEFQTATQNKPDFDVAATVFAGAADILAPEPRAVVFLEGLLRRRQPTPGWVEILTLHRLAEQAQAIIQGKRPSETWAPGTVRKLLGVVRQGEQAAARADSPVWARPWLDAAALSRHLGEVAFDAAGYVPSNQAEGHLDRAADLYNAVITAQEHVQSAVRLRDEAMELLPDYLPYLDHDPDLFDSWSDALHAAEGLDAILATSPAEVNAGASGKAMGQLPGIEVLRAAIERIDRMSAHLKSPLDRLRSPFQMEAVAILMARAKETGADSATWRAMAALLDTPLCTADQRVLLWNAAHDLAMKLDGGTPASAPVRSVASGGAESLPVVLVRTLTRRATEAVGLLKLAGLQADKTHAFEDEILKIATGSDSDNLSVARDHEVDWPQFVAVLHQIWAKLTVGSSVVLDHKNDWPQFGATLHESWAGLIDAREDRDVAARCRLVRALPGAISSPPMDLGLDDPVAEARRQNAQELYAWLADWFPYVGTDRGIDFYLIAAQEYRRGIETQRAPADGRLVWTCPAPRAE